MANDFTDRYEALRGAMTGERDPVTRHGLAIVLRRGVAAWMELLSSLPSPCRDTARRERRAALPDERLRNELIGVVSAMVLGHLEEAGT